MSHTIGQQFGVTATSPAHLSLAALLAPVASEMAQVEEILDREMSSRHAFVHELVRYGCLLGGKRLRPALLLLAARASGTLTPEHLVLAAVLEMIHTATLVHDDVLDQAQVRRHLATVNTRWDQQASILLGDYLFTHAFHLASTLDSPLVCRRIGQATNAVCEGEIRQKGTRANFHITEEEYLEIIRAKTGELCACACSLGAHCAAASADVVARLDQYGSDLGVAFQIIDDVLDVEGDERIAGKSLGTDFVEQKPTLPVIRLLSVAPAGEREQILGLLESPVDTKRRQLLSDWLRRYEAVEYSQQQAAALARRARAAISPLPDSPALQSLARLTRFVVHRSS